jgi:hypothetical protein
LDASLPEEGATSAFEPVGRAWRRAAAEAERIVSGRVDLTRRFDEGSACLARGDIRGADACFTAILVEAPTSARSHRQLGRVFMLEQRWGLAGWHLLDAIALGEQDDETLQAARHCLGKIGSRDADRFIAQARRHLAEPLEVAAPLLSRDVRTLAVLMLGHEFDGDEACRVQASCDGLPSLVARLVRSAGFRSVNGDLIATLAETGWTA